MPIPNTVDLIKEDLNKIENENHRKELSVFISSGVISEVFEKILDSNKKYKKILTKAMTIEYNNILKYQKQKNITAQQLCDGLIIPS